MTEELCPFCAGLGEVVIRTGPEDNERIETASCGYCRNGFTIPSWKRGHDRSVSAIDKALEIFERKWAEHESKRAD